MSTSQFCRERRKMLSQAYLARTGGGEIYECCFLTYLEVAQAAEGRDPDQVWDLWRDILKNEYDTEEPLNRKLGDSQEGREATVARLEKFARRFNLPRRRNFSPLSSRVDKVAEAAEPEVRTSLDAAFDDVFGDDG